MTVLIVIAVLGAVLVVSALLLGLLRMGRIGDEQVLDELAANENVRPLGNVERKP